MMMVASGGSGPGPGGATTGGTGGGGQIGSGGTLAGGHVGQAGTGGAVASGGHVGTGGMGTGGMVATSTGGMMPGSGGVTSSGGAPGAGGSPACVPDCVPGAACSSGTCACMTDGESLCPDGCADLQNDKNHCGSCMKTCPSGCSAGRCFTPLTAATTDDTHIAVNDMYIFFTSSNAGTVSWVSRMGGGSRVIAASQDRPMGIAIDSTNVYWVNQGVGNQGSVMKMPLFGGTPVSLATGEPYPQEIAVDGTYVYWDNFVYAGSVVKVPIAGGDKVTLAADASMVNTSAMTIDGTNAYWANLGDGMNTGTIMKVPLAGGPITTLVSNIDTPVAVGVFNGTVYFATWGLGVPSVKKVGVNGGTVSTILANMTADALAVDSTGLFLALPTNPGTLVQLPLTGTTMTVLARAKGEFVHLGVDAKNVCWSSYQGIGCSAKGP